MTRLLVIGDALLDRDVQGTVRRICPDAPAPVVQEEQVVDRPGGAALAAAIAAAAGAEVELLTALGQDPAGALLRERAEAAGVTLLAGVDAGGTSEKIRIRSGAQTLLRWDRAPDGDPGPLPTDQIDLRTGCDAVLVADYGRGATARPEVRRLLRAALDSGVPVVWDPHPRGSQPVPGITLVTPNQHEVLDAADPRGDRLHDELGRLAAGARRVRDDWRVGAVAVTLGARGALLVSGDGVPLVVPVERPVDDGDTCGAGDSLAAAAAVALGAGAVVSEAVEAGVLAAAAFVRAGAAGALGATTPSSRRTAADGLADDRPASLVATGGCFDVLHAGHVATLEQARRLGDRLVVLLNSDDSVRRLKGSGRPLQSELDRARVLRSLACVDEVVVFDEDTPTEALRRLRPAVFVKGGDYAATDLPETEVLRDWGGSVVAVPFVAGRSTTDLLDRAVRLSQGDGV